MSDAPPPRQAPDAPGTLASAAIAAIAAASVLAVALSVWGSTLLLRATEAGLAAPAGGARAPASAAPRETPRETTRAMPPTPSSAVGFVPIELTPIDAVAVGQARRDEQRRALSTFGWVDRDGGVAMIPIERAMDLVVEESAR